MSETLGLKNVNLLTKEQYNRITQPATDELYAISGSGFGFPSKRYVDLELGASSTRYTAPANGWFAFIKLSSASNQQVILANTSSGSIRSNSVSNGSGTWLGVYVPAKKGDTVAAEYSAAGETKVFRFIYAEGEE